ncbi:hypothetical protein PCO31111_03962 [Pandoraea communis]|uniref:Uncharacterized protein n=1 Tax=Pandoraea communis TaxID=2508297 RepID=A0A5E4XL52_9BURK|nr:hypothetical protein [Pandoraea communis]VVE37047.1 hypothetical protein PCO31111_03962 [Pandoraea communis]
METTLIDQLQFVVNYAALFSALGAFAGMLIGDVAVTGIKLLYRVAQERSQSSRKSSTCIPAPQSAQNDAA